MSFTLCPTNSYTHQFSTDNQDNSNGTAERSDELHMQFHINAMANCVFEQVFKDMRASFIRQLGRNNAYGWHRLLRLYILFK